MGWVDIFSGEVVTLKLNRDNRALVEMLKREEGRGRVAVIEVLIKLFMQLLVTLLWVMLIKMVGLD